MPGPLRPDSERSGAGAIRHWLTSTLAGRALLVGIGLKLLTAAARLSWDTTAIVEAVDTLADIALLAGAVLLIRRLFSDTRGVLLWRVRRKLILSYIFIGFVPVLLVIVFFLTAGLTLFLNVSQYVALGRVTALVEQTTFLAESAAIGLQDAGSLEEVRARLERRQAGAVRTFPFVSYAIVPAWRACLNDGSPEAGWKPQPVVAGPWQHTDPPRSVPDWIGCLGVEVRELDASEQKLLKDGGIAVVRVQPESAAAKAGIEAGDAVVAFDGARVQSARQFYRLANEARPGEPREVLIQRAGSLRAVSVTPEGRADRVSKLVAYSLPRETVHAAETRIHVAARAVAWPDKSDPQYAVIVDVPLGRDLREKIRADTGIEIGDVSAGKCSGYPPGRDFEPAAAASSDGAGGAPRLLSRPIDWVAFPPYVVWDTGESCGASMRIRMTLTRLYAQVSATTTEIGNIPLGTALLLLLALVGALFLLIQIAAFIMGLALARSITGSVHDLFTGTERVRLGDLTHKIPITSQDQLGELAVSFNSMTASIADLLQQKAEKERMEQELRIARSIQMSLLPREEIALPGMALTGHCEPAREVGGDYYDYMKLDEHRVALLIADVAGKGTSAALYMAELKGLMLSLSQLHTSPRKLLIDANRIISRHLDSKSFITITYAVVDVQARTLTYARAGHCPLIYVPGSYASSRAAQILVPDGLVLGLQIDDEGRRFISLLEEVTMPLGEGDVFLFYTDGLTEAMDDEGDCFGDTRLAAIVQEHADASFSELRDRIFSEVRTFAGPVLQQDDMTMLLMRVDGGGPQVAVTAGSTPH